jgi:hypothetical protein
VSVASISQMATDLNCVTVFTGARAYVLKPGAIPSLKSDIMFTARQHRGLYFAPTSRFVEAVTANSVYEDDSE